MGLSVKIILCCAMTLVIALGATFYVIAKLQERLIMGQVENEARAIFRQIVITRQWIADHGGIFVEKKAFMQPNPYLDESEIIDIQGRKYIRSSPAMVTKEISKYAKGRELYWFHITSLKLINPENKPDELERKILLEFENRRLNEFIVTQTVDSVVYLRYMSPLFVEQSCLRCHAKQGYTVGDVRGAISVMIPIEKTLEAIRQNRKTMLISGLLTVLTLIIALSVVIQKTVLSPMRKLKKSIADFSEGKYKEEFILKTGDEFEELSKAFSAMALKIGTYQRELEDKIRDATNELAETNIKLKDTNERLNELNNRKSDFIARASHELRTPLTTIKGAMDYILNKLSTIKDCQSIESSMDELRSFCDLIKKNCERLIKMVSNMLDLERIEQGGLDISFEPVNLSKVVYETVEYMKNQSTILSLTTRVELPPEITIKADEDRIRQVLINIISNAIKFSPQGSEILITATVSDKDVTLMLCDEGEGISDMDKDRVFEKFYKGRSNKEGSGLGLAICKGIIELHNGTIGVKDRDDGKRGACVYFTLPLIV